MVDDSYPYTGYEPYSGASLPPGLGGASEPSSTAAADTTPPPNVAGYSDPRRCMEFDMSSEPGTGEGGSASGRGAVVAYLHDSRRIAWHPLGPVDRPAGVTERFWERLDPDWEDETPLVAVAVLEPPQSTGEAIPEEKFEVKRPAPRPAPAPAVSGTGGSADEPEEEHDPSEMPFLDHLEELRWSLLKSIIVIVIAMIASWYLSDWFYNQITELARGGKAFLGINAVNIALNPLTGREGKISGTVTNQKTGKGIPGALVKVNPGDYSALTDSLGKYRIHGIPQGNYTITASKEGYSSGTKNSGMKLVMTTVLEPLMIRLQMALVMGIVIALPIVFYFLWSFVAPGLYPNERKWILPLVFAATGCFFIGASIAWFLLVPYFLWFLQTFMPPDVDGMYTFGKFLSLVLKFTLGFGIVFEMPVITFALAKIGIIRYQLMAKYRGYALVLIFIVSAIITPTVDPVSQTIMAIPLYLLYEVSIIVARIAGRKTIL